MSPTRLVRPDVLVLAAGGILGEAWMSGVLAGIEDAAGLDLRRCDAFVGTSAGSIVAARLASGHRPRRPARHGEDGVASDLARDAPPSPTRGGALDVALRLGAWAAAPVVGPALAVTAPAGARLRALALGRLGDGRRRMHRLHDEMAALGARLDGRLRICAVDRDSGRRVVFGAPGAPEAEVADAVLASCAIPGWFRPVAIGGRRYVDGGAWSFTNLDAAPAGRDAEVLCLHPAAGRVRLPDSPTAALRAAVAASAEVEALALRARGVRVRVVGPDPGAADAMGHRFMDGRRARAVLAEGYRQGRAVGAGG